MHKKPRILALNGSASSNSSNLAILHAIAEMGKDLFDLEMYEDLGALPHFKTELTDDRAPEEIREFRHRIDLADGILICTPEYLFSIPSRLKNAFEWCVSTTVFDGKPVGLITASANGEKGHEELKLILKTVQARFTDETSLLIQGVKGKLDSNGHITEEETIKELEKFVHAFAELVKASSGKEI